MNNDNEQNELSPNWKLIITYGSPRIVHARGCDHIKDWSISGITELYKFRPEKHNICPVCAGLCYATIGAKDYAQNVSAYKRLFSENGPLGGVPAAILKELYFDKHAKTFVYGTKLYLHVKQDDWYIDTAYDQVRLFHNNYRVARREHDDDFAEGGYHEHKIMFKGEKKPLAKAIKSILQYDYDEAEKSHKKKRRPKITFGEYDPESYGFSSED